MSNRKKAMSSGSSNPANKFLEWKSVDKCLVFYDKENAKIVLVPLPFTFLVLDEFSTIKGFHDESQTGIFSNEVKNLKKEPLTVKTFKGKDIATGLYEAISNKVVAQGGRFAKSIYAMDKEGKLINLTFIGASLASYFEFTKKSRARLTDEWVTIVGAQDLKKGATKYSAPIFEFNKSLNEAESAQADKVFDELEAYITGYITKDDSTNAPEGDLLLDENGNVIF